MNTKNAKWLCGSCMACGLFLASAAQANQLLVPANYPTIQSAIGAANPGDTVLVSPGTYYEHLNFEGKAITVASVAGPAVTIIDGQHAGAVVNFSNGEGPNSVIEGFTFQHGYSMSGSGISLSLASPTIVSNIFQYNDEVSGSWGAAIGAQDSSPVIEQNLFRQNTGDNQFLSGVIAFVNNCSPLVANNIFESNSCLAINMIFTTGNSPVVINNTIVGNPVGIETSFLRVGIFDNNILFDNGTGVVFSYGITWENNLVYGGQTLYAGPDQTGINGNISADPQFVDPSNGDFQLQAGSPCIDAGLDSAPDLPATDFSGGPRIIAGHANGPAMVDMGAYEFKPTIQVIPPPTITCPAAQTVECGTPATVTAHAGEPDGTAFTVVWALDGVIVQTNHIPAGPAPTTTNVSFTADLPLGTNLIEIAAATSLTNTAYCSTTVTVVDTTPPHILSAGTSPDVLWPPNHKMVPVAVHAVVTDNCGPATWKITRVQSNEPVNGLGDGNTSSDWQVVGDHSVMLRAERSGSGSGRIYTITLQAEDVAGNLSTPTVVTVTVPKSKRK